VVENLSNRYADCDPEQRDKAQKFLDLGVLSTDMGALYDACRYALDKLKIKIPEAGLAVFNSIKLNKLDLTQIPTPMESLHIDTQKHNENEALVAAGDNYIRDLLNFVSLYYNTIKNGFKGRSFKFELDSEDFEEDVSEEEEEEKENNSNNDNIGESGVEQMEEEESEDEFHHSEDKEEEEVQNTILYTPSLSSQTTLKKQIAVTTSTPSSTSQPFIPSDRHLGVMDRRMGNSTQFTQPQHQQQQQQKQKQLSINPQTTEPSKLEILYFSSLQKNFEKGYTKSSPNQLITYIFRNELFLNGKKQSNVVIEESKIPNGGSGLFLNPNSRLLYLNASISAFPQGGILTFYDGVIGRKLPTKTLPIELDSHARALFMSNLMIYGNVFTRKHNDGDVEEYEPIVVNASKTNLLKDHGVASFCNAPLSITQAKTQKGKSKKSTPNPTNPVRFLNRITGNWETQDLSVANCEFMQLRGNGYQEAYESLEKVTGLLHGRLNLTDRTVLQKKEKVLLRELAKNVVIVLVAIKPIKVGEELLVDYGNQYWDRANNKQSNPELLQNYLQEVLPETILLKDAWWRTKNPYRIRSAVPTKRTPTVNNTTTTTTTTTKASIPVSKPKSSPPKKQQSILSLLPSIGDHELWDLEQIVDETKVLEQTTTSEKIVKRKLTPEERERKKKLRREYFPSHVDEDVVMMSPDVTANTTTTPERKPTKEKIKKKKLTPEERDNMEWSNWLDFTGNTDEDFDVILPDIPTTAVPKKVPSNPEEINLAAVRDPSKQELVTWAKDLVEDGFVTIPVYSDSKMKRVVADSFNRALKSFPEYKKNNVARLNGNELLAHTLFGIELSNPSSFHNHFVREVRMNIMKIMVPLFGELLKLEKEMFGKPITRSLEELIGTMSIIRTNDESQDQSKDNNNVSRGGGARLGWQKDSVFNDDEDNYPKELEDDSVFSGWLNCNSKTCSIAFECLPGSHRFDFLTQKPLTPNQKIGNARDSNLTFQMEEVNQFNLAVEKYQKGSLLMAGDPQYDGGDHSKLRFNNLVSFTKKMIPNGYMVLCYHNLVRKIPSIQLGKSFVSIMPYGHILNLGWRLTNAPDELSAITMNNVDMKNQHLLKDPTAPDDSNGAWTSFFDYMAVPLTKSMGHRYILPIMLDSATVAKVERWCTNVFHPGIIKHYKNRVIETPEEGEEGDIISLESKRVGATLPSMKELAIQMQALDIFENTEKREERTDADLALIENLFGTSTVAWPEDFKLVGTPDDRWETLGINSTFSEDNAYLPYSPYTEEEKELLRPNKTWVLTDGTSLSLNPKKETSKKSGKVESMSEEEGDSLVQGKQLVGRPITKNSNTVHFGFFSDPEIQSLGGILPFIRNHFYQHYVQNVQLEKFLWVAYNHYITRFSKPTIQNNLDSHSCTLSPSTADDFGYDDGELRFDFGALFDKCTWYGLNERRNNDPTESDTQSLLFDWLLPEFSPQRCSSYNIVFDAWDKQLEKEYIDTFFKRDLNAAFNSSSMSLLLKKAHQDGNTEEAKKEIIDFKNQLVSAKDDQTGLTENESTSMSRVNILDFILVDNDTLSSNQREGPEYKLRIPTMRCSDPIVDELTACLSYNQKRNLVIPIQAPDVDVNDEYPSCEDVNFVIVGDKNTSGWKYKGTYLDDILCSFPPVNLILKPIQGKRQRRQQQEQGETGTSVDKILSVPFDHVWNMDNKDDGQINIITAGVLQHRLRDFYALSSIFCFTSSAFLNASNYYLGPLIGRVQRKARAIDEQADGAIDVINGLAVYVPTSIVFYNDETKEYTTECLLPKEFGTESMEKWEDLNSTQPQSKIQPMANTHSWFRIKDNVCLSEGWDTLLPEEQLSSGYRSMMALMEEKDDGNEVIGDAGVMEMHERMRPINADITRMDLIRKYYVGANSNNNLGSCCEAILLNGQLYIQTTSPNIQIRAVYYARTKFDYKSFLTEEGQAFVTARTKQAMSKTGPKQQEPSNVLGSSLDITSTETNMLKSRAGKYQHSLLDATYLLPNKFPSAQASDYEVVTYVIDSLNVSRSKIDDELKLRLLDLSDRVFGMGYTRRFVSLSGKRQTNGYDCGIHTLRNAETVTKLLVKSIGDASDPVLPLELTNKILDDGYGKMDNFTYREVIIKECTPPKRAIPFNKTTRDESMLSLQPKKWLNDEIVNGWTEHLFKKVGLQNKITILNSFSLSVPFLRLTGNHRQFVMPVHHDKDHWILVVAQLQKIPTKEVSL
jgi:hypothetical protein